MCAKMLHLAENYFTVTLTVMVPMLRKSPDVTDVPPAVVTFDPAVETSSAGGDVNVDAF
jgi:hypothetical protein